MEIGKKMIRRKELHDLVPLSDSAIYNMEQNGQFPRRFALTSRCVVWDLAEVISWLRMRRVTPIKRANYPDVHLRKTRPVIKKDQGHLPRSVAE